MLNGKRLGTFYFVHAPSFLLRFCLLGITVFLAFPLLAKCPYAQRVNYDIFLHIDDEKKSIQASAKMEYINNSPDTLDELIIHFYPLAYASRETAFAKEQLENGSRKFHFSKRKTQLHKLQFRNGKKKLDFSSEPESPEIIHLQLALPLLPSEKVVISNEFAYTLPAVFSRMGYEKEIYHLTQWYPKPAVYDCAGWHPYSYLDRGEFFSEFGDYRVNVNSPCDMILASSAAELDPETMGEKGSEKRRTDCREGRKTTAFEIEMVHDLAFAASRNFHVERDSIILDGGRKIDLAVYSRADSTGDSLWHKAMAYGKDALQFLSREIGDYPYPQFSIVEGSLIAGQGMEYPGMTIIGELFSDEMLQRVIAHEAAHVWFYGALASDERTQPYIDEGFASFYEEKYMRSRRPEAADFSGYITAGKKLSIVDFYARELLLRRELKGSCLRVDESGENTYLLNNYGIIPQKLKFLEGYLGEDLFDKCIRSLYAEQAYTHVNMEDVKSTFARVSGNKSKWFFDEYFSAPPLESVHISPVSVEEGLKLSHSFPGAIPLELKIEYPDSSEESIHLPKFEGDTVLSRKEYGDFKRVELSPTILTRQFAPIGLNEKFRPLRKRLKPRIGIGISDKELYSLYFLPMFSYNYYDGVLAGVFINNIEVPTKPLEFYLLPMISTKRGIVLGSAGMEYKTWIREGQKLSLGIQAKRYGYGRLAGAEPGTYNKVSPIVKLEIDHRSEFLHSGIQYRGHFLHFEQEEEQGKQEYYNELQYEIKREHPISNWQANVTLFAGESDWQGRVNLYIRQYLRDNAYADMGIFSGFAGKATGLTSVNKFYLSAAGDARNSDFTYSYPSTARNTARGFFSQQYSSHDRAQFKVPVQRTLGRFVLGTEIGLKVPVLPIRPYFSALLAPSEANELESQFLYQLGIDISVLWERLHIYLPILDSREILKTYDERGLSYRHRVLFELRIKDLSPYKIRDFLFDF